MSFIANISRLLGDFVLRRPGNLNAMLLPPKQSFLVFAKPSAEQHAKYRVHAQVPNGDVGDWSAFRCLRKLQSLLIHPFWVHEQHNQDIASSVDQSSKLVFVRTFIQQLFDQGSRDRVLVISNFTTALSMIERLCQDNGWPVHRLDGSTPVPKRTALVNDFNLAGNQNALVFLLSSKAGGCGLNIVGANRLIMFDPDWNPANDQQAMARIWRPGQQKKCYIYRLFSTGTIEETMLQRQMKKGSLSVVFSPIVSSASFQSLDNASRSLFREAIILDEATSCSTFDLLQSSKDSAVDQLSDGHCGKEDNLRSWTHLISARDANDKTLEQVMMSMLDRSSDGIDGTVSCVLSFATEMASPSIHVQSDVDDLDSPCVQSPSTFKIRAAKRNRSDIDACRKSQKIMPKHVNTPFRITGLHNSWGQPVHSKHPEFSLRGVADDYLQRLAQTNFVGLQQFHSNLGTHVLRLATFCSGSDSPIIVLKHIAAACRARGMRGFDVAQVLACESNRNKQKFIRSHFPDLPCLFADIGEMGEVEARCIIQGNHCRVPGADLAYIGFSCKSASTLNEQRIFLCEALAKGDLKNAGTTGLTLGGFFGYLKRHRPALVILENVGGILMQTRFGTPIAAVSRLFNHHGYALNWSKLNTIHYWLPQRRTRVWLWATLVKDCGLDTVPRTLLELRSPGHFPIDLFISAGSEEIEAAHRVKRRSHLVKTFKWPDHHRAFKMRMGITMDVPTVQSTCAGLLLDRERDLVNVFTHLSRQRGFTPEADELFFDISQSLDRATKTHGFCACICPNSRVWSSKRGRLLTGREKLSLQGIFCGTDYADVTFESDSLLSDLAGNAFSTSVCMAVTVAVLSSYSIRRR